MEGLLTAFLLDNNTLWTAPKQTGKTSPKRVRDVVSELQTFSNTQRRLKHAENFAFQQKLRI